MSTVLITGANRGIGLGFAKKFKAKGYSVIATCRRPEQADELNQQVDEVLPLDISSDRSIQQLVKELDGKPIDILVNNAGVYGSRGQNLHSVDSGEWLEVLRVNALAPFFLTRALIANLEKGAQQRTPKKIAFLTSKMGSIEDNTSGGSYLYRSSKTALNSVVKSLSLDLEKMGFISFVLHPGWVQTDMGGDHALITVDESVDGLIDVIETAGPEHNGGFFNYDGRSIPW